MTEPTLILEVETPDGVFPRPIMPASILPPDVDRGNATERATRNAAAFWGLPDFVFRSALRVRGSGNRELGDAILVVGDRAASVQVKARQAPSQDDRRERSWLDKKVRDGASQAAGTIRSLTSTPTTTLVDERGREVAIRGSQKTWIGVVVIDHPGLDGYVPSGDAVVLLRQDWEFLFGQLKSTYAVIEYLHRVRRIGDHVPLGHEAIRYYKLAAADLAAPPGEGDPRLTALGHGAQSVPVLPQEPAEHGEIVRLMLEDITTAPQPDGAEAADVLDVLAAIDAAPVAIRADLGEAILKWLGDLAGSSDDETRWWFRCMSWPDRPHLVFGAASRHDKLVEDAFGAYVMLRHQQHLELTPERGEMMTAGVLLTPRYDGLRPWDTTMSATRGAQGFEPAFRAALERLWGPLGASVSHDDMDEVVEAFERANPTP